VPCSCVYRNPRPPQVPNGHRILDPPIYEPLRGTLDDSLLPVGEVGRQACERNRRIYIPLLHHPRVSPPLDTSDVPAPSLLSRWKLNQGLIVQYLQQHILSIFTDLYPLSLDWESYVPDSCPSVASSSTLPPFARRDIRALCPC
jgi:hypothetical protein